MAKSYSTFSDMAASNFASISGPTKSSPTKTATTSSKPSTKGGRGIMSAPVSSGDDGGGSTPTKQRVSQQSPAIGLGVYVAEQGAKTNSGDEKGVLQSWYDWAFGSDDEDGPIITPDAETETLQEDAINSVLSDKDFPLDPRTNLPVGALPRQRYVMPTDPLALASLEGSTQGFNPPAIATGLEVVQAISGDDVDAKAARTLESIDEAATERATSRASFFRQVAEDAEGFHGNTPQPSNDALDIQTGQTTYDIGYGHKITPAEFASGEIHGVQFIDSNGNYIPLTEGQIDQITTADFRMHEERAKNTWRPIFEEMSTPETTYTWDSLDTPYQNVLTSLHYNVRRPGQFRQVVREAIRASEVVNDNTPEGIEREVEAVRRFAEQLRRKNAGVNTAGMDNRVVKELYFAGLIDSHADVSSVLTLANPNQTGIPATAEYGSNPNRRPTGSQD